MQDLIGVDKSLAGIIVGSQQMIINLQLTAQIEGHRFIIEKTVWAPFAEETLFLN